MNRKQYLINGVACQCSITGSAMVSEDGKTVASNDYGKVGNSLSVLNDADGPYFINRFGKRIDLGFSVMEAWGNMAPFDGPRKAVRIDGNMMNCAASNLKWAPDAIPATQPTTILKRVEWMGQSVTVYRNGTVESGGKSLAVEDHYMDPVTQFSRFLYKPFVLVGKVQLPMDDLMAAAGFVSGNPQGMKCPKVLHKDFDMLNYDASNLEWAEFSGQDFQDYINAMISTCKAKSDACNQGAQVPETWFRPPYCPKEYYNYKACGKFGGYKKS